MLPIKEFRTSVKGLSDLLNYAALVDEGVALNKDGSFLSAFYFRGQDLDSATGAELKAVSAQVNAALVKLGNGWTINVDSIRVSATDYPDASRCFFPDPTTLIIDEERRQQHHIEGAHFENVYVLTLTYLVPPEIEGQVARVFVDEGSDGSAKGKGLDYSKLLARFKAAVVELVGAFSARLQLRQMSSGELLTFLHTCITGLHHPVAVPPIPMYMDVVLGSKGFWTGLTPRVGNKHIRTIAINGFPSDSYPGILDALNRLPIEYRWSTRFIALDPSKAQSEIKTYRRNWFQKRHGLFGLLKAAMTGKEQTWQDNDAMRMAMDADEAYTVASEGNVRFGYYTTVIVLMLDDSQEADRTAEEVAKTLGNLGFPSSIEDINAVEAYLGSLPGHTFPNVRRPLMHTLNLADLMPITSIWAGRDVHPCDKYPPNSPPLALAATSGATPFRLNLHVGDLGHTLMVGPPGNGKSTLLTLIMAQHFRYPNAQIFAFDKGYSAFALCKAARGDHYDIGGEGSQLAFCPLAQLETQADRAWAAEWVEMLVKLNDFKDFSPAHSAAIHEAINRLAADNMRSLTHLQNTIQNQELREALQHYTLKGPLGHLLDAEADGLRDGRFQVFELEHLLDRGEKAVIPVLMYLFRQVEKRAAKGYPTLVPIDEAWVVFKNPLFANTFEAWLRVMRKDNVAVPFATQDLSSVMTCSIKDLIFSATATKILLPNPEAGTPQMRPLYEAIGLNDRQIEIISMARPKQDYYLMSSEGRRLFNLGLGPVALAFVGASGKAIVPVINELEQQYGAAWPAAWMRMRNVPEEWIDYWQDLLGGLQHA